MFGQEANVNSLDQMTSSAISTRNIAMNMFEALTTRDENNNPILDLADSMVEAPDHMSYTFKLRPGVKFHNGKPMTSADVAASWDRYAKLGLDRQIFDPVAGWDAPDPATFVVRMKAASPTFIEKLSSFSIPVVIVPAEAKDDPPQQLRSVGTGPWQLVESVPGSFVKLKRYEGYVPNAKFEQRTGFGGYKQACFDTVTFRIVTEGGARVAGLETGELQAVEDVPTKSTERLKTNKDVKLLPLPNWWIQIGVGNASQPPTDDVRVRQAIQRCWTWMRSWMRRPTGTTVELRFRLSQSAGLRHDGEGDLQPEKSGEGEEAVGGGGVQGSADRVAHEQGLHVHV